MLLPPASSGATARTRRARPRVAFPWRSLSPLARRTIRSTTSFRTRCGVTRITYAEARGRRPESWPALPMHRHSAETVARPKSRRQHPSSGPGAGVGEGTEPSLGVEFTPVRVEFLIAPNNRQVLAFPKQGFRACKIGVFLLFR